MRVAGTTRCTGCALSRAAAASTPKGSVGRVVSRSRGAFCGSRAFSWRRPVLQRGLKRVARRGEHGHCIGGVRVFGTAAPAQESTVDAVKEAHGFTLVRQEFVKEYNSDVLVYKHEKSGAQLISVINDDENKTFSANFRTPVKNSYGIPHILEHSVLGGSRKYQVKEPFVELVKGSLNTFLNAMTYPDRTLYPVASCNLQDFYNLVDVYLDAVLFPSCLTDPMIFQQEGWHYEMDSPEGSLSYKGVVFNEMKGAYSSPDGENYRVTMQKIFSENNYKNDSGGDPQEIPKLTFEDFKNYHDSYYHPSNGVFWFYGNDPPVERLRVLDEYLSNFDKKVVKSEIDRQPLLKEPQRIEDKYAAGEQDDRCFTTVNWMLSAEPFGTEEEIAMEFLDYLLLGTQAAPLYKALADSGLGESVIGFGMEDDFVQPFFGVGLKGVKAEDVEKVEKVVLEELERLAQEGFSSSAVEAAVNTIEFSLRENNTGSFPRGISLLTRVMSRWNYDKDALEGIKWEAPLSRFKERVATGEDIFKPLIKKYMLDNAHRVSFTMLPDSKKSKLIEESEQKALEDHQKSLSTEEIAEIVENTAALKKRQSTPDSPEALKAIPCLQLSDIPKEIPTIPTAEDKKGETTYLSHDLFTNNILYLDVVLELRTVPLRLLPLVPLFCESLTQLGTEKEDFVQLTERIGRKVGALSVSPFVSSQEESKDPVAKLFIQGKATKDKGADLVELMHDILTYTCFDNPERFKQLVLETKAGLEAGIVASGNSFASMRLSAKHTTAGYVNELMGGYSYLVFIRSLVDRVENDWNSVLNDLEELREILMNSQGSVVNMTGDEDTMSLSRPHVEGFLEGLPSIDAPIPTWSSLLPGTNEALVLPTQVNYVGKAVNLFDTSDFKYEGSAAVIQRNITLGHLWEKVRALGGAYGCSASLDPRSGMLSFVSYRDPNVLETLKNYDAAGEYLKNIEVDKDSIVKDIIGTMSSVDMHQLPDAKGRTALTRKLLGITEELRQLQRDQILSTSVEDYRKLGDYFEYMKSDDAKIVAVTSQPTASDVLKENPDFWDIEVVQ